MIIPVCMTISIMMIRIIYLRSLQCIVIFWRKPGQKHLGNRLILVPGFRESYSLLVTLVKVWSITSFAPTYDSYLKTSTLPFIKDLYMISKSYFKHCQSHPTPPPMSSYTLRHGKSFLSTADDKMCCR